MAAELEGKRILVTRAREQAAGLKSALEAHGAVVRVAPAIRFEPPVSWKPLDDALQQLASFDWIVFTSSNAVRFFLERLRSLDEPPASSSWPRLGAIGPSTKAALDAAGLKVDLVPARFVAEEFFEALRRFGPVAGQRFLLPRADIAREALPRLLDEAGADVEAVVAYRTVASPEIGDAVDAVLRGEIDVVTFTSGSTVEHFFAAADDDREALRGKLVAASLGPVATEALRRRGFEPAIAASEHTAEGLVDAIRRYFGAAAAG